jgi:YHS domain-containing protein
MVTGAAALRVAPAAAPQSETAAPGPPPDSRSESADNETGTRRGDPFYPATCAVCATPRWKTGTSITHLHAARELRFCSAGCRQQFAADPAGVLRELDEFLINDQRPHYPVTTSIVSGEPLGEYPLDLIWHNRLIRLAAEKEKSEFLARPEAYLAKLDQAVIRAQSPVYGPTKCPVQGDFLDESQIVEIVIGNRMIRLCCAKCAVIVRRNPAQYVVMVDSSNREAARRKK